jgi:mannan endo-1,6-alpha-mannosidase
MTEVACETNNNCDTDQQSFKGYLARWLGHTTKVAPFAATTIQGLLQSSGKAAVATCTGGSDGNQCGLKWTQSFDGTVGAGEQMAVLEMIQSNLQPWVSGPVTANTGGSSQGNPAAGGGGDNAGVTLDTISTSDRAGAGILTTLVLITTFGGAWWMASK